MPKIMWDYGSHSVKNFFNDREVKKEMCRAIAMNCGLSSGSDLTQVYTQNSPTVTWSGSGTQASPLIATVIGDAANPPNLPIAGTNASGVLIDGSANVITRPLTGLSVATNALVLSTDSIVVGVGKLQAQVSSRAPLNNAPLEGIPTAPTAAPGTNSTQLATTAFVQAAVTGAAPTWGSITGTLTAQTDLQTALNSKLTTPSPLIAGVVLGTTLSTNVVGMVAYSQTPMGDSLAMYNFGGQLKTAAPVDNNDATTKLYVDTAIAGVGGAVASVFGRTGVITAQANDYTFAQIASKPTTISGYGITDALLLTSPITGYSVLGNAVINATDTILQAFGKIQGSLNVRIGLGSTLSGFTVGANTALTASNTILTGFGVVQGQLNAKANNVLTGYQKLAASPILATDTVLVGLGKLEGAIDEAVTLDYVPPVWTQNGLPNEVIAQGDSIYTFFQKLQGQTDAIKIAFGALVINTGLVNGGTATFIEEPDAQTLRLTGGSAVATFSIVFPSSTDTRNGQILRIYPEQDVTTLTLDGTGGETVNILGTPLTSLTAHQTVSLLRVDNLTWIKL